MKIIERAYFKTPKIMYFYAIFQPGKN